MKNLLVRQVRGRAPSAGTFIRASTAYLAAYTHYHRMLRPAACRDGTQRTGLPDPRIGLPGLLRSLASCLLWHVITASRLTTLRSVYQRACDFLAWPGLQKRITTSPYDSVVWYGMRTRPSRSALQRDMTCTHSTITGRKRHSTDRKRGGHTRMAQEGTSATRRKRRDQIDASV